MTTKFRRGELVTAENDPNLGDEKACPVCKEITSIPPMKAGTFSCSKDHVWHRNHGGKKYHGYHIDEDIQPRIMTDEEFIEMVREGAKTQEQFEQTMKHSGFRLLGNWVR
jgi:hypothetical protein